MKKLTTILAALVIGCGLLTAPVAFTGCGTPAAKTTQVAGTLSLSVDAAMKSWGEWVRAGKATVEQRIEVRGRYAQYQAAMRTAEAAAVSAVGAPANQAAYTTALNAAVAASVDLIALVQTFKK
jgi:hypothetical protein